MSTENEVTEMIQSVAMKEHDHVFDGREICDFCFLERVEIEDKVFVSYETILNRAALKMIGLRKIARALVNDKARLAHQLEHQRKFRAVCGCGEYMDEHQNVFESGHAPVVMAEDDCRRQSGDLESVMRERDKLAAEVIRLRAGNGPSVVVDYED